MEIKEPVHITLSEKARKDLEELHELWISLQTPEEMNRGGTLRFKMGNLAFYGPEAYYKNPFEKEVVRKKLDCIKLIMQSKDWSDPDIDKALERMREILTEYTG